MLVQGVDILITLEAINQYFGVPDVAIDRGHGLEFIDEID